MCALGDANKNLQFNYIWQHADHLICVSQICGLLVIQGSWFQDVMLYGMKFAMFTEHQTLALIKRKGCTSGPDSSAAWFSSKGTVSRIWIAVFYPYLPLP